MFKRKQKQLISFLVPRRQDHGPRDRLWDWLSRYWKSHMHDFEIVIGEDWAHDRPFSKAVAVNDAARKAKGDIFVIIDSDAYLSSKVIQHCAQRIRRARRHGVRLWFVPYVQLYRLTEQATEKVLASDPRHPYTFPSPPCPDDVMDTVGSSHGHKFGAMITIMPREAFKFIGGMDERFRGWGGEDVSFLRALDTLWAKHKNTPNDVLHLWHPKFHIGEPPNTPEESWKTRVWGGQDYARINDWLAIQYNDATNKPRQMRSLVNTGFPPPHPQSKWWQLFKK